VLLADGTMLVMRPDEKAYTQVASVKVSEKGTYAGLVVAGNRMFVRDQEGVGMAVVE